jgi:hypothetical protein
MAGFCEHGNEPSGSMKKTGCCLISCVTISFSRNILHYGVSTSQVYQAVPSVEWTVIIISYAASHATNQTTTVLL